MLDSAEVEALKENLSEFLCSLSHNAWIAVGPLEVYLRQAHHALEGRLVETLDIANISIAPERCGKGAGSQAIKLLRMFNPYPITYIENVLNERLAERLRRDGWIQTGRNYPYCFYLRKGK